MHTYHRLPASEVSCFVRGKIWSLYIKLVERAESDWQCETNLYKSSHDPKYDMILSSWMSSQS